MTLNVDVFSPIVSFTFKTSLMLYSCKYCLDVEDSHSHFISVIQFFAPYLDQGCDDIWNWTSVIRLLKHLPMENPPHLHFPITHHTLSCPSLLPNLFSLPHNQSAEEFQPEIPPIPGLQICHLTHYVTPALCAFLGLLKILAISIVLLLIKNGLVRPYSARLE